MKLCYLFYLLCPSYSWWPILEQSRKFLLSCLDILWFIFLMCKDNTWSVKVSCAGTLARFLMWKYQICMKLTGLLWFERWQVVLTKLLCLYFSILQETDEHYLGFLLETSNKSSITVRQGCALESCVKFSGRYCILVTLSTNLNVCDNKVKLDTWTWDMRICIWYCLLFPYLLFLTFAYC